MLLWVGMGWGLKLFEMEAGSTVGRKIKEAAWLERRRGVCAFHLPPQEAKGLRMPWSKAVDALLLHSGVKTNGQHTRVLWDVAVESDLVSGSKFRLTAIISACSEKAGSKKRK